MNTAATSPGKSRSWLASSAFDEFGGQLGARGPRDGWGGGKSHLSLFTGGKPESSLLVKLAKDSQPARPGAGRGHELSLPAWSLAGPATL